MYILLITHISFLKAISEDIVIRKSVFVLRSIFISLQLILVKYGISLHKPKGKNLSFGYILILILNHSLRPFVEKRYSVLLKNEQYTENSVDNFDWPIAEISKELKDIREILTDLINLLAKAVDIKSVIYYF